MKTRTALLIVAAIVIPMVTSSANPKNDGAELKQIDDRDFKIATLLHSIYEHSVRAEEVEKKVAANGGERTPHDDLPAANIKNSIKNLEDLADVPSLRAKLSKDLESIKKSRLGPKHPDRRWLELLSRSLEKYSKPTK